MIPGSATPLFLLNQGDSAYKIERSLRFNDNDSAYLSRTPSSAGNRKTWTWSGWVKRSQLTVSGEYIFTCSAAGNDYTTLHFGSSDDKLNFQGNNGSGSLQFNLQTTAVFRDPSAWYHIVLSVDSTQATDSNKVKIYVNGELQTFSTATYPPDNFAFRINTTQEHRIGSLSSQSTYLDSYLADVHFIDGQALAPTDFGEYDDNNVWQPIEYTFGTNPNNGTTWSTGVAGDNQVPNSQAFDGSLSTWAAPNNNGTLTWTPPSTVSVSSSLRIYAAREASTDSITVTFSDSSTFTSFDDDNTFKWYTITGAAGKTISNIAWTHANSKARISAIEVDGYVLIDGTVDNSFHLDFSDNSSNAALGDDSSGNNNDWTVNNLVAEQPTTLPGVAFDGSGDYLSLADSADFDLVSSGTGDFTIEFYINKAASADMYVLASGTDATRLYINASSGRIHLNNATDSFLMESSAAYTAYNNATGWIHIAFVKSSSTGYVFVNGTSYAAHSGSFTLGGDLDFNDLTISRNTTGIQGFISNLRIVKGSALYTSSFTPPAVPLTNVTNTKLLCCQSSSSATAATVAPGTITANGDVFATEFSDSTSANDSLIDTPTNYTATGSGNNGGNYATLNPLASGGVTLSNGNLDASISTSDPRSTVSTISASSGKWYAEVTCTSGDQMMVGVVTDQYSPISGTTRAHAVSSGGGSVAYQASTGNKRVDTANSSYGATYGNGDVIGIALNLDDDEITFYKNNASQGTITGKSFAGGYTFFASNGGSTQTQGVTFNFGQRPFAYTPPTGYLSLCTTNLPDPTIADGSTVFDVVARSGGGTTQILSFSPDLFWMKRRDAVSGHYLFDSIRTGDNYLRTDSSAAEVNSPNSFTFNSNGYTVPSNFDWGSSATVVDWAWDGGTSNTSISVGGLRAASTVSSGNAYSVGWAGVGGNTWADTDSWSGLSAVSNNAKGYFSGTENLSDGSQISVANGSFSAGNSGSNGWVLRASSTVTIDFTTYSNVTEIATTSSDSQTFADRTIVATNPATGSSVVATGKCFWFKNASQMSVSHINIVNDAPASPSIASTVRANPSAGFSIVSFTPVDNSSIGHSLNAIPELIIYKNRDSNQNWRVYHKSVDSTKVLYLNTTDAATTDTDRVTAVTSTTFSIGNIIDNDDHIAYCFAPVEGYSAFGSYTGNGSTDGPFVFTNFRPALVICKPTTTTGSWQINDSARNTFNVADEQLFANESIAATTTTNRYIDFLSNGFKVRGDNLSFNGSGHTYVYLAFAENPFKTARAR